LENRKISCNNIAADNHRRFPATNPQPRLKLKLHQELLKWTQMDSNGKQIGAPLVVLLVGRLSINQARVLMRRLGGSAVDRTLV